MTVSKAAATVKADATSKVYGTANPPLTAAVTGQVPGGDAVAYTLATTATTHSNVGEYPITVTLEAESELRRDVDRRQLDGEQGGGDRQGRRDEQGLRHGESTADRGGDRTSPGR